ncbi:MAG TPA: indolepyruvate ferredoxin oxidoreductase family protein, partial [Pseudomonadota bacterium]|nr:indolepyruvate ferredoxin oxidoreductase family protein [Pseudomonadota bacterium]
VPDLAAQVHAEGVRNIVLMSDDIAKWLGRKGEFPHGTDFVGREHLDAVQKRLRETPGVSVLIYEQTCAAEKRRRRKRKLMPDPPKRVFINEAVCEGCGDCGVKSNCVSVLPVETEFGRKRAIDQSNCNKDYSCVNGFCPSFVTVHGGSVRKRKGSKVEGLFDALPLPTLPALDQPWNILVTGIGGTGVVTIGALIGMAAHLEGKGTSVLDQTGLAQKGGAVTTHVRVANAPKDIHAVRIAAGEADLVLGCDIVVVNDYWALSKIRADRTRVVLNTYEAMPGTFTRDPDMQFPGSEIVAAVRLALEGRDPALIEATELATTLLGDSIATNLFMLGFAWQQGLVPVSLEALMRAIELNDAAIAMNKQAFAWGRLAAHDPARVRAAAAAPPRASDVIALDDPHRMSRSLDETVARRVAFLTDYQDAAYASQYKGLVDRVTEAEKARAHGLSGLAEAVARYAFKLMAYKDEYEVARLYTRGDFEQRLRETFDGDFKLRFHLAPPRLAKKDDNGHLVKREYGPWMFGAFRLLAKFKGLRGTALDVFGYSAERREERALIGEYRKAVEELVAGLTPANHALAVEIAQIPEHIRGYGHVKEAHLAQARVRWHALMSQWRKPQAERGAA